ncbi:MAG: helix-hairpin-helix domain-containing protein [Proteobacteria bacterium]|nr:helix-hairpin-helix domain-containing protein [Pseudomonadota bacterium]
MKRFLTILVCSIVSFFSFASLCFADNLTFTVLDVGQADAMLIQTAGKIVLLDAGEDKEQVKNKLLEKGIRNLDVVFATHPHADHVGGMLAVLQNIGIKTYIDNGFPHTTKMYEDLMTEAELKVSGGMRYISARKGQRFNLGPEAHFEVLWPDDKGISGSRSDVNANSIVMKLVHGNVCFILTGDAEAETEQAVLNEISKCQILKVAHHGSPHSSIDEFLDKAQPDVALISCGLANKHGHPGERTLQALQQRNAKIYRTDWQGEITVVSDGVNYTVTTEKNLQKEDLPCIDVNNGTAEDFGALKGVGKVTIDRVMEARAAHAGPYPTVEAFLADLPQDASHRLGKLKDYFATDCSYKNKGGSAPVVAPVQNPTAQQYDIFANNQNAAPQPAAQGGVININVASASQLASMPGMDQKKADAAIEYRSTNGPFASCKDLQKVKGIGAKTVEKLLSVCTTGGAVAPVAPAPTPVAAPQPQPYVAPAQPAAAGGLININVASADQIATMPGLSAAKANEVVNYRTTFGPFASCLDLQKVKGIGAKTVDKLLMACTTGDATVPAAQVAVPQPQAYAAPAAGAININTASAAQIATMPGLSATKAEAVVTYRSTNGPFASCQDLTKVKGIGAKTVEKLISACTVR